MQVHVAEHLSRQERIQLGSYYTPKELVALVHKYIAHYLSDKSRHSVLFDSAGGCGAFISDIKDADYRIADRDKEACDYLRRHFEKQNVFHTNTLLSVNRDRYRITDKEFLIIIGNPPYNDITSEFKNGEKGKNVCDKDLYDRDVGISFLKSYSKLNADVVCVLHPLSYLIKESNFNRLKVFKDNYRLVKGTTFSSALFKGTGSVKFPIIVALYEKDNVGMSFDYINNFKFDIYNEKDRSFTLSKYKTTDGYIDKYPPRRNDDKISPIGLYYYTFRDYNSLKKNASFFTKYHPNGIVVTLENFYKYAYLFSLKELFRPENSWLYGNLSPLVNIDDVEKNKDKFVLFALHKNKVLFRIDEALKEKIIKYYNVKIELNNDLVDNVKLILSRLV